MKKFYLIFGTVVSIFIFLAASTIANAQAKETYNGTVVSFGSGRSTRTIITDFKLYINGYTSDEKAQRFLNVLKDEGQDDLKDAIDDEDLGRFSVGANVGVPINVVRTSMVDGKRRIFIVFERWTHFAELRYGLRTLDYPFGVIELFIDENTGKGEGTYIAAARIRWDYDGDTKLHQVEIENFATFPAKLISVERTGKAAR